MASLLQNKIEQILGKSPGLPAREICGRLPPNMQEEFSKHDINSVLYSNRWIFRYEGNNPPLWFMRRALSQQSLPEPLVRQLNLWPWQLRALEQWHNCHYKGVVEAVTGTGKTLVGVAAAQLARSQNRKVAVIVPTRYLQKQWKACLCDYFSEREIGLLGDDEHDTLTDHNILVATVQTGHKEPLLPDGCPGLLIADECHHYGAQKWSGVLGEQFEWRLGLTAVYDRDDGGVEEYLKKYFKGICYQLGYKEALEEGYIAHFKIALLGVGFTSEEDCQYKEADESMRRNLKDLKKDMALEDDLEFPELWGLVNLWANSKEIDVHIQRTAQCYLSAFSRRREVLANAQEKLERLVVLRPVIEQADRAMLFTEIKEMSRRAVSVINDLGISASYLYSELAKEQRKQIVEEFKKGEIKVLAAPKLLDEGVDFPDADLGIIVSASRSKRQMIQRMGRILRKKDDERVALIVILFVEKTSEDPKWGAHETFIEELKEVADNLEVFSANQSADDIYRFLNIGLIKKPDPPRPPKPTFENHGDSYMEVMLKPLNGTPQANPERAKDEIERVLGTFRGTVNSVKLINNNIDVTIKIYPQPVWGLPEEEKADYLKLWIPSHVHTPFKVLSVSTLDVGHVRKPDIPQPPGPIDENHKELYMKVMVKPLIGTPQDNLGRSKEEIERALGGFRGTVDSVKPLNDNIEVTIKITPQPQWGLPEEEKPDYLKRWIPAKVHTTFKVVDIF